MRSEILSILKNDDPHLLLHKPKKIEILIPQADLPIVYELMQGGSGGRITHIFPKRSAMNQKNRFLNWIGRELNLVL